MFRQQCVQQLRSIPKVCRLQPREGRRQIHLSQPRRLDQDAERSRSGDPTLARGRDTGAIIHHQQRALDRIRQRGGRPFARAKCGREIWERWRSVGDRAQAQVRPCSGTAGAEFLQHERFERLTLESGGGAGMIALVAEINNSVHRSQSRQRRRPPYAAPRTRVTKSGSRSISFR